MTLREALDALHKAGRLDEDSAAWAHTSGLNCADLSHYLGCGDPCLTGCLSALAREASGDPTLHAVPMDDMVGGIEWLTDSHSLMAGFIGTTEVEAWAAAIIAMAEALP